MNYLSRRYHVNAFEDVVTAKETGVKLGSIKRDKTQIQNISKEVLIDDLSSIVNQYELSVLLLNSRGEVEEEVNKPKALDLLDTAKSMSKLGVEGTEGLNAISSRVAGIAVKALNIKDDQKDIFETLLQQFINIELVEQCSLGKRISIVKKDKSIDYKINRIAKYLGMDLNLDQVHDFSVEYGRDIIIVNGQEYFNLEELTNGKGPKVNRIVRK